MATRFRRWSQSGAISIQTVTVIVVLVIIGYIAYKFVPPYVTYYRVKGVFQSEVRRKNPVEQRANIEYKLRELPYSPITLEDVKFERDFRSGELTISADYTVTVKLLQGYTKTLVFHPTAASEQ